MPAANASAELSRIAAALREVGDRGLRLELSRGLRSTAKPLTAAVRDAALRQLPHGGGLNQQVASQRVTVSVLLSARTTAVRLKTTAPDTAQTDSGYVRHPVYGNRGKWVTQSIPQATGWWSKTLAESAPVVTAALVAVMRDISARIEAA